jgi:hypothetical protein
MHDREIPCKVIAAHTGAAAGVYTGSSAGKTEPNINCTLRCVSERSRRCCR